MSNRNMENRMESSHKIVTEAHGCGGSKWQILTNIKHNKAVNELCMRFGLSDL